MLEIIIILAALYLRYLGIIRLRWLLGIAIIWGIYATNRADEQYRMEEYHQKKVQEKMVIDNYRDPDNASRSPDYLEDYEGPPAGFKEDNFGTVSKKELELSNEIGDAMEHGY